MADKIQWAGNTMPKSDDRHLGIMSLDHVKKARAFHQSFPQYTVTPLARLDGQAARLGLSNLCVKDESYRFGLNAFKVLGGSFAMANYIADETGKDVAECTFDYLTSDQLAKDFGQATFFTATDGNHGRGVAWAANKLGQKAVVHMPKGSTKPRFDNIAAEGATVTIEEVNYDECVRMAAAELRADLDGAGGDLSALEGLEYSAEFFDPTDKLGADKPNPKSHVAYGFATHVVILDDDGRVKEVYAAHDSGKVVNPTSIQGQIEGGVLMGLGYALTEDFPLKDCVPQAKFGTLGLMRADQIPDIHAIYVEKEELLPFAYGAKGIGEIATIPTAPAAQGAYYARDHILRTCLPMQDTFYKKPAKKAAP